MRKGLLAALGAIVIGFSSCEKVKDAVFPDFEADAADIRFTIPAITTNLSAEQTLAATVVSGNIDSIIRANTDSLFGYSNVNSVKISKVEVKVASTDTSVHLGYFENASVSFFTNSKTTPVEIAATSIPNAYTPTLTIVPANPPELKEYFAGSQLTYTVKGKARRATKATPVTMTVTLSVQ